MTEIEKLRAVEKAARRLIKEGLRLTPDGLIVRESEDSSDPHWELCEALDVIEPLNDPGETERAVDRAMARFYEAVAKRITAEK